VEGGEAVKEKVDFWDVVFGLVMVVNIATVVVCVTILATILIEHRL